MSRSADFAFSRPQESARNTGSTRRSIDVDLLDLVALHDDESHRATAGFGYPRALEPFTHSRHELRLVAAMEQQFGGNVTGVTVRPTGMPDASDFNDIAGCGFANEVRIGTRRPIVMHHDRVYPTMGEAHASSKQQAIRAQ
jgi:hypothetical protein